MNKTIVQKLILEESPRLFQEACECIQYERLDWAYATFEFVRDTDGDFKFTLMAVAPDGDPTTNITPATFHNAVTAATEVGAMNYDLQKELMQCIMEGDGIDREMADALVQFYIFGELIFG